MSANELIYGVGVTLVAVATGATATPIIPPPFAKAVSFKYSSGGTLAVVDRRGFTAAQGWILGTSEVQSFNGPSVFFLAAAGSTSIAAIEFGYSYGYSSSPG